MSNPTVVFSRPKTVVVEDRPTPEPGPGQVLVRTRRTLISTGTELTILSGEFPESSAWSAYGKFPFTPGYNSVGVITQTGEGVDEMWKDKRVALSARHAAFVTAPLSILRPIPDTVADEHAVFFTIAEIVMNGVRRGRVIWGETAVIYGAGLLGQICARFCLIAGARPVVSVDVSQRRLDLLPGRVNRVQPPRDTPADIVSQLTRKRMADVVFEVTGNPDLLPQEFAVLRRQGRAVILSSPRGPSTFDFHDLCNAPSYTIIGAHNGSHPPAETPAEPWSKQRHDELFLDLLADGTLDMAPLISHRVPYTQAPDIYAELLADRTQAMGVVLTWD